MIKLAKFLKSYPNPKIKLIINCYQLNTNNNWIIEIPRTLIEANWNWYINDFLDELSKAQSLYVYDWKVQPYNLSSSLTILISVASPKTLNLN